MAYHPKNLSAFAYSNGQTLWGYVTPDPAAETLQPGYFRNADSMVREGDVVFIRANHGGAYAECVQVFVTCHRRGVVEVQHCHPILRGPTVAETEAA